MPPCRRSTVTPPWPRRGCSSTSPVSPTTTGCCPPWTRWWDDDDIATVVPDPEVLAGIRADEQRMPLAYFRSRLGAPDGWVTHPQAYLALGDTYAEETAWRGGSAGRRRCSTGALHLHHLVDPDAVADRGARPRRGARRVAQERSWSRGDDHGVTGRGTATPSSSRSVRSE